MLVKDKEFFEEIQAAIKYNDVDWLAQNIHWIHKCKAWADLARERTAGAELFDDEED